MRSITASSIASLAFVLLAAVAPGWIDGPSKSVETVARSERDARGSTPRLASDGELIVRGSAAVMPVAGEGAEGTSFEYESSGGVFTSLLASVSGSRRLGVTATCLGSRDAADPFLARGPPYL